MNSSLSFVLKSFVPVAVLAIAGCGELNVAKELGTAEGYYNARNFTQAARTVDRVLKCAPDNVDAIVLQIRVKLALGEIADAKEAVAKAVTLAPDDADVISLDAEVAYHAKDYAAAVKSFRRLTELPGADAATRSLGWTGIGIVELESNNRELAQIAFLRAINLDRRNPSARYHLGILYMRGDDDELEFALEQFEVFARLEADDNKRVADVQGKHIPAIQERITHRAAKLPGVSRRDSAASSEALRRGDAAWKKGTFKTARVEYDKAYNADVLSYEAALGLARAWEKTDTSDYGRKKAYEYYLAACKLKPSKMSTLVATGALAMKRGEHATAARCYSRAISANPKNLEAIDGFIRALRKCGGKANTAIANAYQSYRDSLAVRK